MALSFTDLSHLPNLNKAIANPNSVKLGGNIMSRYYIDCRDFPSDIKCSVALSADSKEELLDAVVQHGTTVHKYEDTPEFRENIVKEFKEGHPPA